MLGLMLIAPLSWRPNRNLKIHLGWNGTMTCWTANFQCERQKQRFLFLSLDCFAKSHKLKIAPSFLPWLLPNFRFRLKIACGLSSFRNYFKLQQRRGYLLLCISCSIPRLGTNCFDHAIINPIPPRVKIFSLRSEVICKILIDLNTQKLLKNPRSPM